MTQIDLKPEMMRFAELRVAEGAYRDVAAVVDAALDLLRRQDEARAAFRKTLDDAMAEADRDGVVEWGEIEAELDAIIAEADARIAREAQV